MMVNKKRSHKNTSLNDYVKAVKRGSREAEYELYGPGFHASHHVHRSLKTYTRKQKQRGRDVDE